MKIDVNHNYDFNTFLNLRECSSLFDLKVFEYDFNPIESNTKNIIKEFSQEISRLLYDNKELIMYNVVWKGENKLLNKKRKINSEFSLKNKLNVETLNFEFDSILYKVEKGAINNLDLFSKYIYEFQNVYQYSSNLLFEDLNSNQEDFSFNDLYIMGNNNKLTVNFKELYNHIGTNFSHVYLMDSDLEYGVLRVIVLSKKDNIGKVQNIAAINLN